jgi:WD40 repeat protein
MSSDPATPTPDQQRSAEELFDVVRLLPPAERDAAILSRTADPWVRAEVRSLLRFDEPTVETLGSPRDDHFDAAKCVGLSVGGFTLRSVIGVGGMGTVFEAEQELPARRIAVKVLHSATARASTLARFRKESEFLARLDHPNIARVIAAGTLHLPGDVTARPYFAMELVDGGRSLSRWAREERVGRSNIIRTFVTVCEAVGSGHRAGIVHLDLKPGNLLVSRSGALRVIDYGIARSLDATEEPSESAFAGTPQYMSPEQLTRGARVDSRADVYALGLILYELLAGRFPYETRGESMASVVRIVRESRPTNVRLVDATVPADLAAIVDKALAKDPDDRYGTASELADDLKRWLSDEPVLAAPATLSQAALRAVRRNPVMTSLAAIALAAVVVSMSLAAMYAISRVEDAKRAERDAAHANLRAASAALGAGDPVDATEHLRRVPPEQRGWEARHLQAHHSYIELFSNAGNEVYSVRESPSTNELFAGITGGFIEIIDLARERPTETINLRPMLEQAESSFPTLTVSPDGMTIVAGLLGGGVVRYDRATSSARRLPFAAGVRTEIAGDRLVCVDFMAGVSAYSMQDDRVIARFPGIGGAVDASFSDGARSVVVALQDGRIRCLDLAEDHSEIRERWLRPTNPARTRAVAISPDGSVIAVVWNDGRVSRLSPSDGSVELEKDLRGGSIFDLAISPDNTMIAASSWANQVQLVDVPSLRVREVLGGTVTHVWNIAWSRDSKRLFGRVHPPRLHSAAEPWSEDFVGAWPMHHTPSVRDVDFGRDVVAAGAYPDGSLHVIASSDGRLAGFTPSDGSLRELGSAGDKGDPMFSLIALWRGASERIALAREDGTVVLGEIVEGKYRETGRARALDARIHGVAFSPDGESVACAGQGDTVAMVAFQPTRRMWTASAATAPLIPGRAYASRPIFLADGQRVTFVTSLSNSPRLVFRTTDGAVVDGRTGPKSIEYSDGIWRPQEQAFYMLGITGGFFRDDGRGITNLDSLSRHGGLLALNDSCSRLFAATRDGAVRVAGFDPPGELMRLESRSGRPVSLAFSDRHDELTVVTTRGFARTWCGTQRDDLDAPGGMPLIYAVEKHLIPDEAETAPTQR